MTEAVPESARDAPARYTPALAALGAVGGVCVLVVAYEAIGRREYRVQLRHPELSG
jgi:hypothetical protein